MRPGYSIKARPLKILIQNSQQSKIKNKKTNKNRNKKIRTKYSVKIK
jgi:hypothetical protein